MESFRLEETSNVFKPNHHPSPPCLHHRIIWDGEGLQCFQVQPSAHLLHDSITESFRMEKTSKVNEPNHHPPPPSWDHSGWRRPLRSSKPTITHLLRHGIIQDGGDLRGHRVQPSPISSITESFRMEKTSEVTEPNHHPSPPSWNHSG